WSADVCSSDLEYGDDGTGEARGPFPRQRRAGQGLIIPEHGSAQQAGLLAGKHEYGSRSPRGLQAGLLLACKGREAVFPPQEIREARAGVLRVQMGKAPRHVLRRPEMAAGINLRAPAGFRRRGGIDILVKDALGGI